MLFREMVAVYCENQMKHTNTVFWENPELRYVNYIFGTIHVYIQDETQTDVGFMKPLLLQYVFMGVSVRHGP
jgi:hypothetical protein